MAKFFAEYEKKLLKEIKETKVFSLKRVLKTIELANLYSFNG